jgi:hypothetical protein
VFGHQEEAEPLPAPLAALAASLADADAAGMVRWAMRQVLEVVLVRGDLPARNPVFAGREGLLSAVREALLSGDRAVVQALHGMGGVGKTQLAIEYAHRYAASYDVVWWVNAEQAALIGEQFAALGGTLGCAQAGAGLTAVRQAVLGDLAGRDRWLLVFDNAGDPEEVARRRIRWRGAACWPGSAIRPWPGSTGRDC